MRQRFWYFDYVCHGFCRRYLGLVPALVPSQYKILTARSQSWVSPATSFFLGLAASPWGQPRQPRQGQAGQEKKQLTHLFDRMWAVLETYTDDPKYLSAGDSGFQTIQRVFLLNFSSMSKFERNFRNFQKVAGFSWLGLPTPDTETHKDRGSGT